MTRLLGAELDRLRSRRSFWVFGLVALALLATFQLAVDQMVSPPSAAEAASARQAYEQAHQQWQEQCAAGQDGSGGTGNTGNGGNGDGVCDQPEPQASDYLYTPATFAEAAPFSVKVGVLLAALLLFLVGASSIGAEYGSGAIGNWLTYVPRRGRVYAAKVLAVATVALAVGALFLAVAVIGPAVAVGLQGAPHAGAAVVVAQAARSLVLPVVAGLLGFCAALLTRHTVGALGVALGYLLVMWVRTAVLGEVRWAQRIIPWLPESNLLAIVDRGYHYQVSVPTAPGDGTGYVERVVGLGHGVAYTAVLIAIVVAVSGFVFRRRDVG